MRIADCARGRTRGDLRHTRHDKAIQRRRCPIEARAETDRGIEGADLSNLHSASAAANATGIANATRSPGLIDAETQCPGAQATWQQRTRDTARRLTRTRAKEICFGDGPHEALDSDIEIVLDRKRERVRQRELEMTVVNELVETWGVLQLDGSDWIRLVRTQNAGERLAAVRVVRKFG